MEYGKRSMGERLGQKKFLIGLDIGGTKIEAIFWSAGKIARFKKIITPKNKRVFLEKIFLLIRQVAAGKNIAGIGIASAGAIDHTAGKILNSPNLKFLNGLRLGNLVGRKFSKPTKLENDANCFLLAEWFFGQAKNKKNVVGLTIGTGVGGAVLIDGELLRGTHGAAGELGHMVISHTPQEPLTLEKTVASHGFRRLGVLHPKACQDQANAGSRQAQAVYNQVGSYLGLGLANFVNIFDPELIIIGGGIARAGHLLLDPAKREMKKHSMLPANMLPVVKISKLDHVGALGAVSLFLR